jgi:pyrroline-5-carboxylate reductase
LIETQNIAFIGPGVMAEAMISGLIRRGVTKAECLTAAGPTKERLAHLAAKYAIHTTSDNAEAARQADIVALTVKPQLLDKVIQGLRGNLKPEALVLSIIAGATIEKISQGLGHNIVVRSMPNTPAQIGEGITVWTASRRVSAEQREMARQILQALGEEIFVEEEGYLDMATALSGTGPAYVFLFMEAMVDAGVHLGFPRRIAEQLVAQTMRGSVDFYRNHEDSIHLARLRNQVTSPGGTSAAALYYLEKAGFRTAISRAIWAAYERSRELGKSSKPHDPEEGVEKG